jgi:hypothetical protein
MAQLAKTATDDFWRPANSEAERHARPFLFANVCNRCGMDYAVGARYCHLCGIQRYPSTETETAKAEASGKGWRQRLGLTMPSLVLFVIGATCLAVVLGMAMIPAGSRNLAEVNSIQFARTDWLLAAVAAMLGGILLKKKKAL